MSAAGPGPAGRLAGAFLDSRLTPLAILASFSITEKVKAYMMLFLFLETGMLGVFMSLDLLVFFVFWEVGLVPMYFLINQWGSANRNYASLKFMIYTMGGSLGLLLAVQLLGVLFKTYDLQVITAQWSTYTNAIAGIPASTFKTVAFWAFVIAFAVKVPLFPFVPLLGIVLCGYLMASLPWQLFRRPGSWHHCFGPPVRGTTLPGG